MRKSSSQPVVAMIIGSYHDWPIMQPCYKILTEFGINVEIKVLSAHRSPDLLSNYIKKAKSKGIQTIIAAAGLNASLAGCIAAQTILPVISVPIINGPLNGIDALLASSQMPSGIPVATVTLGVPGAINAAILATQILALSDKKLAVHLQKFKEKQCRQIIDDDQLLNQEIVNEGKRS